MDGGGSRYPKLSLRILLSSVCTSSLSTVLIASSNSIILRPDLCSAISILVIAAILEDLLARSSLFACRII